MNISLLVYSGLEAIYDYVLAHTLFCLVPAFFIAGAMAALIPKDLLLPYLGKKSPKHVAYPIAVVTGLLLGSLLMHGASALCGHTQGRRRHRPGNRFSLYGPCDKHRGGPLHRQPYRLGYCG